MNWNTLFERCTSKRIIGSIFKTGSAATLLRGLQSTASRSSYTPFACVMRQTTALSLSCRLG
eukprot:4836647-Pleurochrysis_carterae.AAC.2